MTDYVFKAWEFPSVKVGPPNERYLQLIISPDTTGYEKACVLLCSIPPESSSGKHKHLDSAEIMYCMGRGESIVNNQTAKIETDSIIVAPAGVYHECRNTSKTETLKLLCVFMPPIEFNQTLTELAIKTRKHLGGG